MAALLIICIVSAVTASLEILALKSTVGLPSVGLTSLGEILQNPSSWVNKTVVVEGNFSGCFFYFPEKMDWSYKLSSNGSTIGVSWHGSSDYSSAPARVYGVFREKRTPVDSWVFVNETLLVPGPPKWSTSYYIEAERIELLPTVELTSVDEIILNPLVWVNKTVVVEGSLSGPMGYIAENAPPWNYQLCSNGTLGALWPNSHGHVYSSTIVRIHGVVRQGTRAAGIWPISTCYYIEAETIDIL